MTLYRLRWYLDDIASAVRFFRRPHQDGDETQRWWAGLTWHVEGLAAWRTVLD